MARKRLLLNDMVVARRRVGMVTAFIGRSRAKAALKFGPDGPLRVYETATLRRATSREIKEAGLAGVGRRDAPDEEGLS